jgi:hypothetical protein
VRYYPRALNKRAREGGWLYERRLFPFLQLLVEEVKGTVLLFARVAIPYRLLTTHRRTLRLFQFISLLLS